MLAFLAVIALFVVAIRVFRGYIAFWLAHLDFLLFMFVKQGEIRFIMRGKSLERVVSNIRGKIILDEFTPPDLIPPGMSLEKNHGDLINLLPGKEDPLKTTPWFRSGV